MHAGIHGLMRLLPAVLLINLFRNFLMPVWRSGLKERNGADRIQSGKDDSSCGLIKALCIRFTL